MKPNQLKLNLHQMKLIMHQMKFNLHQMKLVYQIDQIFCRLLGATLMGKFFDDPFLK